MDIDFSLPLDIKKTGDVSIDGVYAKSLVVHHDARGNLTELWSQPWSQSEPVLSEIKHVYWNITHAGVIKAWHMHRETVSQYTCVSGKLQVVLVDMRVDSPTRGQVNQFLLGTHNPSYIKIPPGVLKGWKSVAGDSVIVNLLSSADIHDNFKYPWDVFLKDVWEPKMG